MLKIATKFVPAPTDFLRAWVAGFRYAEFWLSSELLQDAERIIKIAEKYPCEYVPHFPNKKNDAQSVKQAVKLYRELDCRAMVIHQPMFDAWENEFTSRDRPLESPWRSQSFFDTKDAPKVIPKCYR